MNFDTFDLLPELHKAIQDEGYEEPTDIQQMAIPTILSGRNIVATAQTGSGKTAAFVLPLLHLLHITEDQEKQSNNNKKLPRALILVPTRELAQQIADNIETYGTYMDLRHTTLIGGVKMAPQIQSIEAGTDIIVATPGRLLDLIKRKKIDVSSISKFILDEADRMIDMGFIDDIVYLKKKVAAKTQDIFFSATMSDELMELAEEIIDEPEIIEADRPATTVDSVESHVYYVESFDKLSLLKYLLMNYIMDKVLVFVKTRDEVEKIAKGLYKEKLIRANVAYLHGEKDQHYRERTLNYFKTGRIKILVATDVASRGIDIDDITHVIQYHVAEYPEDHVHRVGRTARAGRKGHAYVFCAEEERRHLGRIEDLIGEKIPQAKSYPFKSRVPFTEEE